MIEKIQIIENIPKLLKIFKIIEKFQNCGKTSKLFDY